MKKNIVTGEVKNMETGEITDIPPFYLFRGNFEINTFVRILHVQSFFHREDKSRQILVDCLALDSCGFVFKLALALTPKNLEEKRKILADMVVGKILAVRGDFSVLPENEGGISLLDPEYSFLPPECRIEEIEEVFRMNNLADKNRLN
ncbi:MAG: hypothetical protein JW976_00855 [Syntrophaceae bacterium]|nr:hypothetical protein [Syntrophaceae bacterium]